VNALGILYLVLAGVAAVAASVHVAQAFLIRSDRTQAALAALCLGFGLFDLAITYSSEHTGAPRPTWEGWHLLAAASAAGLTVAVPLVGWLVLELPFTPARRAVMALTIGVGLMRLAGVSWLVAGDAPVTWERLHSLDNAWIALPSVACALLGGGVWAVEGFFSHRRGVRYARSLMIFGVMATLASLHGVGVTLGLVPPPDVFGLLTLPAVGFVQVLSSVRFVQAMQSGHQPAGDMARYEVLAKLGSGGMGDLFLARRKGPAGFLRDVVLKTLQGGNDAEARERFLAEARLAAQLRHPNIVDVYDLGSQPGGFFIVMEHIHGVTLSEALRRAGERGQPVPPDVVAELGAQMCRALSFAHAARVIHRDIKRQNVMVEFAGLVKLIDFGIAQEAGPALAPRRVVDGPEPRGREGLTQEGRVIGTPGYIAPERLEGHAATAASDLFAVGVVLYELLTNEAPFAAGSSTTFVEGVRARSFTRLASARPDASAALAGAVEQCLDAAPERRPASAAALQVMLEQALEGRRVDLAQWVNGLFPGERAGLKGKSSPRLAADAPTVTAAVPRSEAPTTPQRPAKGR
jgi:serine/threonine-protein kinase